MKPLVIAKRVLLYYSHAPAGTPRTSGSSSSPGFGDGGGVLRHELQDVLPLRLRKIVLEGEKIENLHPAAFKHLRSRRLELIVRAGLRADLDRDIFLNLGRVQNFSLDVSRPTLSGDALAKYRVESLHETSFKQMSSNDPSMNDVISGGIVVFSPMSDFSGPPHMVGNPVTTYSPNHPRAVFLHDLKIGGNEWICTCEGIGWVEKWLRRWRGIFCGHSGLTAKDSHHSDVDFFGGTASIPGKCVDTIRDLRNAKCGRSKSKKSGNSVLNDLKTSLECDAFNAAANNSKVFNVTLVVLMSLLIKRLA